MFSLYSFFLYCIFIIGVKNILFKDIFRDNCFILFYFVLTFLFLSLSSVSAAEYNFTSSNITDDFQSVIDNDTDDKLVINLDDGDYSLDQINVSRNATIQGKSRNTKIVGTGNGILFNITSNNVKIINLTITGFDTAIQSNNGDLRIDGNNITTNGISIDIHSVGNDLKGINIENNIIVSSIANYNRGALYISALDNSNIIISVSLIGNNIRGNSPSDSNGVRIRGAGCSNNITFTNNNITGSYGGIYLYGASSNNANISFINNNITGESRYGVSFDASSSNNSWFQFSNNKIIGSYGGVDLSVAISSNTNISFTNNNIIGTPNGVHLFSYSSKNTNISFNNNNITGISNKGVQLSSYSSNNTNISFINNNITGTDCGVDLSVYKNSKSQVIFTKNNITGGLYGVYVYSFEGNISGVSFLNNNITSYYGDGFYFEYFESPDRIIPITSINISNFTINYNSIFATNGIGLNFAGLYSKCRVNVTVKYNHINALIGVNITGFNLNSSFDYNWWGFNDINGKILGINTKNHYILNIINISSLNNLKPGDNFSFIFLVLNTTLKNDGVEILPYFIVNGTFNGVEYITSTNDLFENNFTISGGNQTLDASLDDQYVTFNFIVKNITNSTIVVSPYTVNIGENIAIYGQLDGYSGDGSDFLTVSIDGNDFNVTVEVAGGWNYNYTAYSTGNISVIISYCGNENYTGFINATSFNVAKYNTNSTININPLNVFVGDNVVISGYLANYTNIGVVNVIVGGHSYLVDVNDTTGFWSLSYIATHAGLIDVIVGLSGNPFYEDFTNSTNFDVIKADTNSTIVIDPLNVFVGDNVVISGYLANYTNIGVVNVIVDGFSKLVGVDNVTGFWSLDYTANRAGAVNVIVGLSGNPFYEDFNNSTNFTVKKFNVVFTLAVSGKNNYGETIKLKSKLTKSINMVSLKGKLVKFYVNNKLVGSKKTDSNGVASFNYKIVSTKRLTFKTVFAGDSEYNNKTSNIIAKIPSKATVNMALSSKLYKKRIKVVLKFKGKPLKSKYVKFYVKGKYVGKTKTNSKGIALFKYTKKYGKIAIKTVFTGDSLFKSVKSGRKIKI